MQSDLKIVRNAFDSEQLERFRNFSIHGPTPLAQLDATDRRNIVRTSADVINALIGAKTLTFVDVVDASENDARILNPKHQAVYH